MKTGPKKLFILLQASCGLIFGPGILWFVSTFRELLSTGGSLNPAWLGLLAGL